MFYLSPSRVNFREVDVSSLLARRAIYQTHASPFWMARVLDPNTKKYVVRSTKETARLKARDVAEELADRQV